MATLILKRLSKYADKARAYKIYLGLVENR